MTHNNDKYDPTGHMTSPTDPVLFLLHRYGISHVYDTDKEVIKEAADCIKDGSLIRPAEPGKPWPELVSWLKDRNLFGEPANSPKL